MRNRIESFQVVRGIAVALVFLSHCEKILYINEANRLMYLGGMGVSIFIAMSGFLEAYKYSEKEPSNALGIVYFKWRKFFWLHIVTLIMSLPLSLSLFRSNPFRGGITLVTNGLLLQTWIPKSSVYFSFNAVSWYLSVTLFFAMILPLATKLWKKIDVKQTVISSFVLLAFEIILCLVLRNKGYAHWVVYVFPVMRGLDFILGGGYYRIAQNLQENGKTLPKLLLWCSISLLVTFGCISMLWSTELFSTAVWTLPATWLIASVYYFEKCKAS